MVRPEGGKPLKPVETLRAVVALHNSNPSSTAKRFFVKQEGKARAHSPEEKRAPNLYQWCRTNRPRDFIILTAKARSIPAQDVKQGAEERPASVSPGDETH